MDSMNEQFYKQYGCLSKWNKFANDTKVIDLKEGGGGIDLSDIDETSELYYFLGGSINTDHYDKVINKLFEELDEYEATVIGSYDELNDLNDSDSNSDSSSDSSSDSNSDSSSDSKSITDYLNDEKIGNFEEFINEENNDDFVESEDSKKRIEIDFEHPSLHKNIVIDKVNNNNVELIEDEILDKLIELGYVDELDS